MAQPATIGSAVGAAMPAYKYRSALYCRVLVGTEREAQIKLDQGGVGILFLEFQQWAEGLLTLALVDVAHRGQKDAARTQPSGSAAR